MRIQGFLAVPVITLGVLLASCTAAPVGDEGTFPTDWPELESVEGVLDVQVDEMGGGGPQIYVQLDDTAEPVDVARVAAEARDVAADLAAFDDGFSFVVILVRPGDYPPSASGLWQDETQFDADFEPLVATLAAFDLPASVSKVSVQVGRGFGPDPFHVWHAVSFVDLDEATVDAVHSALVTTATGQGAEIEQFDIDKGFPGQ